MERAFNSTSFAATANCPATTGCQRSANLPATPLHLSTLSARWLPLTGQAKLGALTLASACGVATASGSPGGWRRPPPPTCRDEAQSACPSASPTGLIVSLRPIPDESPRARIRPPPIALARFQQCRRLQMQFARGGSRSSPVAARRPRCFSASAAGCPVRPRPIPGHKSECRARPAAQSAVVLKECHRDAGRAVGKGSSVRGPLAPE